MKERMIPREKGNNEIFTIAIQIQAALTRYREIPRMFLQNDAHEARLAKGSTRRNP